MDRWRKRMLMRIKQRQVDENEEVAGEVLVGRSAPTASTPSPRRSMQVATTLTRASRWWLCARLRGARLWRCPRRRLRLSLRLPPPSNGGSVLCVANEINEGKSVICTGY
uniref:Uncharacterized protein n=1 Tax=Oryza glaberrima TaxID=4538 RepID=I1NKJ0_ORYGL